MAPDMLTRRDIERLLSVTERNAIVMRMRNGTGPEAKRHAAAHLKITVQDYDRLCEGATVKLRKAKEQRENGDTGRLSPVAAAAMDAAGVERILHDPIDDAPRDDGLIRDAAEGAREASIAAEEGLRARGAQRVRRTPDTGAVPGTNRDKLLAALQRHTEPVRQKQLGEEAGVRPGSIVDALLQLDRAGLAERIERDGPGPSGRGVFWQLTPLGSRAGAEQRTDDGRTAPDADRGRDRVPLDDATEPASSAPDHSDLVNKLDRPCAICGAGPGELHITDDDVESEESPPGTAAGLPSAGNDEPADDEADGAPDAPGGDEVPVVSGGPGDIPSPDIGLGDPGETVSAHSQQPPEHRELEVREDGTGRALPPAAPGERVAVGNGHVNMGGIEVTITQGEVTWRDIYLGTLIAKVQGDPDGQHVDHHVYDRIERLIGIGSGTDGS